MYTKWMKYTCLDSLYISFSRCTHLICEGIQMWLHVSSMPSVPTHTLANNWRAEVGRTGYSVLVCLGRENFKLMNQQMIGNHFITISEWLWKATCYTSVSLAICRIDVTAISLCMLTNCFTNRVRWILANLKPRNLSIQMVVLILSPNPLLKSR